MLDEGERGAAPRGKARSGERAVLGDLLTAAAAPRGLVAAPWWAPWMRTAPWAPRGERSARGERAGEVAPCWALRGEPSASSAIASRACSAGGHGRSVEGQWKVSGRSVEGQWKVRVPRVPAQRRCAGCCGW